MCVKLYNCTASHTPLPKSAYVIQEKAGPQREDTLSQNHLFTSNNSLKGRAALWLNGRKLSEVEHQREEGPLGSIPALRSHLPINQ
jgi:hypothetical protein